MKIKKRKFNFMKKPKLKNKILPICFSVLFTVATLMNSQKNCCRAANSKLYEAITTVVNNPVLVQLNEKTTASMTWNEYLLGVGAGEMSANDEKEALFAQLLAAKTYALFHLVNNYLNNKQTPIASTTDFQVYLDKETRIKKFGANMEKYESVIQGAIDQLKNLVVVYYENCKNNDGSSFRKEKLAETVYCTASGNKTEDAKNIWGKEIPYLKSVDNSFEQSKEQKTEITLDEAFNLVKAKHPNAVKPPKLDESIVVKLRNNSNRVQTAVVFGVEMSGNDVRRLFKLKSTDFNVSFSNDNKIIFSVNGFGHGVGLAQDGAKKLAQQQKTYDQIIKHYYTNVEIKNIEDFKN